MLDLSLQYRALTEVPSNVSYRFYNDVFEYDYYLASQAYFQQYAIDIYIPEVIVQTDYINTTVNLIQTYYQNQENGCSKYLKMGRLIPKTPHQKIRYIRYTTFRNDFNTHRSTEWLLSYVKGTDLTVTFNQYRNILFDAAMTPLILPCIHIRYNTKVRQEYRKAISLDEPTKSPHKVILLNKKLIEKSSKNAIYKGLMKEFPASYDCRICEDTSAISLNMQDFIHKLAKPSMKVNAKWTLPTL